MLSAGWVCLSSSRTVQLFAWMSGWVEHSSPTSMVLLSSAFAIGVSHADRYVTLVGARPYASLSALAQTGLVLQSVARPHLSWFCTAVVSLIFARCNWSTVSLRTTKAFWSKPGV